MRIETERLYLRPITLDDANFIQAHFSQPDVLEHLPPEVPNPYPADGALWYIQNMMLPAIQAGRAMEFIIHHKQNEEPMGAVMVERKCDKHAEWRRGFWLSSKFRGQRYMEEASLAVTHWLFSSREAKSIVTANAPANIASARIKEKQGFQPIGLRKQIPPFHNGETEAQYWQMTRERFYQLHGKAFVSGRV